MEGGEECVRGGLLMSHSIWNASAGGILVPRKASYFAWVTHPQQIKVDAMKHLHMEAVNTRKQVLMAAAGS